MPNMRTVRTTPPPPGNSPNLTSGKPSLAFGSSTMTRWWAASAISRPPPSAAPLIAATTGLPSVSSRRSWLLTSRMPAANSTDCSRVTVLRSLRSPPAKNVFLADVRTTPLMSSFSASRRSTVAPIDSM